MKTRSTRNTVAAGLSTLALALLGFAGSVQAEQVKDPYHPQVNGSPITLMKDNMLTQSLGGRLVDLDVWVGEFIKFDDNIFNTSENKKNDVIYSTAAGFKMEAQQKETWKLRLEGQMQYNAYGEHNEYNGMEGYVHAAGSVDFSPALSARVSLNYDNTYDNVRNVSDIYALHQYAASAGVSIKPSPFAGLDVDYAFFAQRRDVSEMDYQNYNEHTVSLRPYYDITPNTTLYMQISGSQAQPSEDEAGIRALEANTSQSFTALAGAAWKYKDAAKLYAEAGYKYMHFDDSGAIRDDDDVSRPVFRLGGEYALNADWNTGLNVSYLPMYGAVTSNAARSNYLDRTQVAAFLAYSPGAGRFTAKLSPYYSQNTPSVDESYKEYGAHLGLTYSVTDWCNVSAGYRYSVTDYDNDSPYDRNAVTFGVAATF